MVKKATAARQHNPRKASRTGKNTAKKTLHIHPLHEFDDQGTTRVPRRRSYSQEKCGKQPSRASKRHFPKRPHYTMAATQQAFDQQGAFKDNVFSYIDMLHGELASLRGVTLPLFKRYKEQKGNAGRPLKEKEKQFIARVNGLLWKHIQPPEDFEFTQTKFLMPTEDLEEVASGQKPSSQPIMKGRASGFVPNATPVARGASESESSESESSESEYPSDYELSSSVITSSPEPSHTTE